MIPLLMAGGGGTRLWPLSREKFPKQFQLLTGKKSLLQITMERLSSVPGVGMTDIFISTNSAFVPFVVQQTGVAPEQIIIEPCRRDNAAAILLSILKMKQVVGGDDAVVGMFPADHIIANTDLFIQAVLTAEAVASANFGAIVQMGVRPTYSETGYGYIEMGDRENFQIPISHFQQNQKSKTETPISQTTDYQPQTTNALDVYRVAGFTEKPDEATARKYVSSFRYLWNTGIFFFRIDTILKLYEQFVPDLYDALAVIPLGTPEEEAELAKVYPTVPVTSIDYAIMEHAREVFVLPLDHLGWSDVGHFKSLWEVLPKDDQGNVVEGGNALVNNTQNSIVYGNGKLIVCIGLDNVVVVDTGDVLLVTTKEASQDIKSFLKSEAMKGRAEFL